MRGVASKQLVKSDVSTVPAEFVSYQQVVCPLPQLDIHKPDQLSNFNLKDNTDHSRHVACTVVLNLTKLDIWENSTSLFQNKSILQDFWKSDVVVRERAQERSSGPPALRFPLLGLRRQRRVHGQYQEARMHLRRRIAAHPDLQVRADCHAHAEHQQEPRLETHLNFSHFGFYEMERPKT